MELFTPEFGLVFWMFVSFAILFFILARFAWPYILKSIDERAKMIDEGVEKTRQAEESLANAKLIAERYEKEAIARQTEILREADRMKTQIIEEARSQASVEAKKVMDAAQVSIEQMRKEAEARMRDEVSTLAIDIATKVVRQQMADNEAQSRLVNTLLDEISEN
ncbi:MAG: F0F1 ATP synthase subunit B [Muribaculaceae bacterium]|nr:F0F1 ATP synthase subunit B [Muribaculaceae bacterium]MBP5314597.1 F0F1 ATP synthase subunit B [Muribaculaceae bacterium]MBR5435864.1 F0F1 ATP synthase subunit B [Muribaculaceae bacterium]MBR5744627.1 F0F1 ATP synthase subunit B [Muribaculaceae bacterium]